VDWGWAAAFWPETAESDPRVHAAELPIWAEKGYMAKADKSWETYVDVKRLTYYHRDTGTYDVEFVDRGEAFSVPRHLIATVEEAKTAKENYEKSKKASSSSGDQSDSDNESGSDRKDKSDDEESGDDSDGDGRGGGGGGGDRSARELSKKQDKADKEAIAEKEAKEGLELELTKLLSQVGSNALSLASPYDDDGDALCDE
jgi:hypothetical protein